MLGCTAALLFTPPAESLLCHSNDVPFNDAKSPLSLVALNMGDDATNPEVYGNPTNNIVLPYNKTVEVTLWNTDSGAHPFHLHGHHVQLASRVGNYSDPSIDTTIDESQKNPMRRDTVQVEGVSVAVLVFP